MIAAAVFDDIAGKATALQNTASDPGRNVWAGASAGTGKTKVLTDRVLRLLLPAEGRDATEPGKILCITFTKAGANEMIARIMKTLSLWAVCSESDLDQYLMALVGREPTLRQRDRARRLFAVVTDTPGGLKVTTIHAFCQSVLGRFPVEAGLSPQFTVIEDSEAAALIRQARNDLIDDILDETAPEALRDGFRLLSRWKNGDQLNRIIKSLLADREKLADLRLGMQGQDAVIRLVYDRLGAVRGRSEEDIVRMFCGEDEFPKASIMQLAAALDQGTLPNRETAERLREFCRTDCEERIKFYDHYHDIFTTAKGEIRSAERAVTKNVHGSDPAARDIFIAEGVRLTQCVQAMRTQMVATATESLLHVGYDLIDRYKTLKMQRNALDYDDLIYRTRDLLGHRSVNGRDITDWVLYKLDGGIDHLLVDEAQDTSPAQWQIILQIIDEFFSGLSARDEAHRTVFVVGDDKQSIFSFQGADPATFGMVRETIAEKIKAAGEQWAEIPMATSFRSVDAVLSLVDAVFSDAALRAHLVRDAQQEIHHISYRQGQAGRIDIWPVYKTPPRENRDPWVLPLVVKQDYDAQRALAGRIADEIAAWLENGEILEARGRPVAAGDIMILVRRRNALVDHLVRVLKDRKIPVSGVDRMVVAGQIAVQDVLAVLAFALMPDDDLSLAAILKSPFIGWDDATLMPYACERTGTLWQEIRARGPEKIVRWLEGHLEAAAGAGAFQAISTILTHITPNQGKTGWQAVLGRMGQDAVDPLQELLSMAQRFDRQDPVSGVQGFLHRMESDAREIKRELDEGRGQVRIMTVHASKGLQAPIVILPDTTAVPAAAGASDDGLVWCADNLPLWAPSAKDGNALYESCRNGLKEKDYAEYCRLLYVALTRAEDRLIICGMLGRKSGEIPKGCWYELVTQGYAQLDPASRTESAWQGDSDYMIDDAPLCRTYQTPQRTDITDKRQDSDEWVYDGDPVLPEWSLNPPKAEQHPPRVLTPSKPQEADPPVHSPLRERDDRHRFRRGLVTHSLLQYLPDMPETGREQAAAGFLRIHGGDLPPDVRTGIVTEVMAILNDPEFTPFFAAGSLAEVPLSGKITDSETGRTDIVSGQIDRLAIGADTVWIVDYKSNRPPPRNIRDIPVAYKNQLLAYKKLIGRIYPGHAIRCALLWTDGPFMTELKDL